MKFSIKHTALALGATLALGVAAHAQQQSATVTGSAAQTQERSDAKKMRRGGRHHRRARMGKMFKQINLTDAQKEQMRSIATARKQATRALREELFRLRESRQPGVEMSAEQKARIQELRAELRQAKEQSRAQVLAILTTEQRAQIEQRKQQREQRRAERRARFGNTTQNMK